MTIADADFDSTSNLEAREAGPGRFPVPPVGELPAGGAEYAVPHHFGKAALVNQYSRAYRWSYDEALRENRTHGRAMLNDLVCRQALDSWMVPVSQLSWHLDPRDPTDPRQVDDAKRLTDVILETPNLEDLFYCLEWGEWFGRQGAALLYEWKYGYADGKKRMRVREHRPIHGDSLVARWDGSWGMLVNGAFPGDKEPTDLGFAHFFTPTEREATIIHYAPPFDVDFFDSDLAGQIRGSGLRGHVFWFWFLRSNFIALVADYAERFANGIWKGWYDQTNPTGKEELASVLSEFRNAKVLQLPQLPNGYKPFAVEIEQVGTANPDFLLRFISNYFDNYIRDYLSGASLSHGSQLNVGGDGVEYMRGRVSTVVQWRGNRLANTLTRDWMPVLTRYNCGETAVPPYFRFDTDRPNSGEILGYAKAIKELGGDIDLSHLYECSGLPEPAPGTTVASAIQPLQPTAVTQTPVGVPVATQPQQQPTGVDGQQQLAV